MPRTVGSFVHISRLVTLRSSRVLMPTIEMPRSVVSFTMVQDRVDGTKKMAACGKSTSSIFDPARKTQESCQTPEPHKWDVDGVG